jgi:hypothetical protein
LQATGRANLRKHIRLLFFLFHLGTQHVIRQGRRVVRFRHAVLLLTTERTGGPHCCRGVAFDQLTFTSNTALSVRLPTPLGCLSCLKRGQKTRFGTFLSVSPAPCSGLGMMSPGSDGQYVHRVPAPIDWRVQPGSQTGIEMMQTCAWAPTGVETPERLPEGVIESGEPDAV